MTLQDPNADVTETRRYDPVSGVTEVQRTVVRNGGAAWWIAGAVAAVAIGAVAFMVASQSTPTNPDPQAVAAAADQGRAEGYAQGAQTAAVVAQSNAQAAQTTAQINAQSDADRAAAARARAELAADRAAMSAQSSAQDASATASAQQSSPDTANAPQ